MIVLDGSGLEYRVVLRSVSTEQVIGDVVESGLCEGEPGIEITLYQAIIKGDKFEYVLQKGTELGVSAFVPMICERSIPNARNGAMVAMSGGGPLSERLRSSQVGAVCHRSAQLLSFARPAKTTSVPA